MVRERLTWLTIVILFVGIVGVVGFPQIDRWGGLIRVLPEVNLGQVAVDTTVTREYVFTNAHTERATINTVGFLNATNFLQDPPHPARAVFEVVGLALPTTLPAGGQFRFTIRFTPPAAQTYRPGNTLTICVTTEMTRQHIHYYIPLVGQGVASLLIAPGVTFAGAPVASFAPPWAICKVHHWGDKKGGGTDLVRRAAIIPNEKEAAGGNLYIRGDTHTTFSTRWAKAEASFLVGGTFTPTESGRYRFVFHYTFTGDAKFEMRGHRFRFRASAAVVANVGDVCAVARPLCSHSDRGGKTEQEELVKATISAIKAVGHLVTFDPVNFAKSVGDALYRVVKVFEGKSFKIPLKDAHTLEVVCDLEAGKTYQYFLVVGGTVYAKAEDGSKAEARIDLEVRLHKVEVFRGS